MASLVKDDEEDESQRTSPSTYTPSEPSSENFRTVVTEIVQQAASELMHTLNLQVESYLETTLQKAFVDFQLAVEEKIDSTTSATPQRGSPSPERVLNPASSRTSVQMEPKVDEVSQSYSPSMCGGVPSPSSSLMLTQEAQSPGPSPSCAQDIVMCTSVCSIQDIHITRSTTSPGVSKESVEDLSMITSVSSFQQEHLVVTGQAISPLAPHTVSYTSEDQDVSDQTQQPPHVLPLPSQDLQTWTPTTGVDTLPTSKPVSDRQEEQVYVFQEQPTSPSVRLTPLSAGTQSPTLDSLCPSSPVSADIMDTLLDKSKAAQQSTSPALRLLTPSSVRSLSPALSVTTTPLSFVSADSAEVLQEEQTLSRSASVLQEQLRQSQGPSSPVRWLPPPSSEGSQSPASIVSVERINVLQEVTVNVKWAQQQSTSPVSVFLTHSPGRTLSPTLSSSSLSDMAAVRSDLQEDLVQRLPTPSPGGAPSPATNVVFPSSFVSADMDKEGDAEETEKDQQPFSPLHRQPPPQGTPAALSTVSSTFLHSADIQVLQECSAETYDELQNSMSPLCRHPTTPIEGTHFPALIAHHSPTPQLPATPTICRLPTPLPTATPSPALSSTRSSSVTYVETNLSLETTTITTLSPAPNSSDKEPPLLSPPDTGPALNVMVTHLQDQSQTYKVAELSSSPGWKCSTPTSEGTVLDEIDPALIFTSLPSEAYADEDEVMKSAVTDGHGQGELDYISPALDSYSSPILKSSTRTSVSSCQDTLDKTMTFTSPRSDGEDEEEVIAGGEGKLMGKLAHSRTESGYYSQTLWTLPTPGSPREDARDVALSFTSDLADIFVDDTMTELQEEMVYPCREQDSLLSHVWKLPSLEADFISTSVPTDTDEDDDEFLAAGIMKELMEEAWVDSRSGQYDMSTPPAPSITPNFPQGRFVDENEGSQEISTQTSVSSFKYLGYDDTLEAAGVEDYITDYLDYKCQQRDPLYLSSLNSSTLSSTYSTSCPRNDDVTKACVMMEFLEEAWTGRDPSTDSSLYQPYGNKLGIGVTKHPKMSPPPMMQEIEEMSLEDLVQQLKRHPGPSAQGVYTESNRTQSRATAPLSELKKNLSVVMKEFFDSLDERQLTEMSKGLHTIVVKDQLVNLCIEILQLSTQTIVSLSKSSEMFATLNHSVADKVILQNTSQNYNGTGTDPTFRTSFGEVLSDLVDKDAMQVPQEITHGIVNTVTNEVNTILTETVQVSLHNREACSGTFHSCQMSTCDPCTNIMEEVSQEIQSLHKRPVVKKKRPWCLSRWCKRKIAQNSSRK
ncbi:uncharacterized protein ACB058_000390 [Synchiropus picturatus]